MNESSTIIGYSLFELSEECYQYNEDACYIASSREEANGFLENCGGSAADCRIDAIKITEIMTDFGASSGQYAMEFAAFSRFKKVAEVNAIQFKAEPFDGDDTLMVVEIDGVMNGED